MNFVTIFASIGLVFVFLYIFWYIMNKLKSSQTNYTTNELPVNYMTNIGLRCPDYYINTSNNNNMNVCKNSYNLNQNINEDNGRSMTNKVGCKNVHCYQNTTEKLVNFEEIPNWNSMNNDERIKALENDGKNNDGTRKKNVTNRCDWIKCCGRAVGNSSTYQPWLEIQDYCDSTTSVN